MLDFSVRLQENNHLLALLAHYARQGSEDRSVWQDRLMKVEGIDSQQLTTLHGELIAFDWIEQNTGEAKMSPDGTIANCYRITQEGLREFRRIHGIVVIEESSEPSEESQPRKPRKKKTKNGFQIVTTSE
jgi:hypothetical protein